MSGKRKVERAADEEGTRLWTALTRVVALTPEALKTRYMHVVTLKLDGVRICLCCKAGACSRIDALGRTPLETSSLEPFVLDAEEHAGVFWVFDALMTQGRDLRSLALADRLQAAAKLLEHLPTLGGHPLRMKPYYSLRTQVPLQRLLQEATAATTADGVIFCDISAAYETPPLKFKASLTVDFCLESQPRLLGSFFLLTQKAGRLRRFRLRGKECVLVTSAEERQALGLPAEVHSEDGIIVECAVPCERRGRWRAVRRRPDRRHPNCLSTVLDTLAMKERGLDQALPLWGLLPPVDALQAFDAWLSILRRRLVWDDSSEYPIVELHGATRANQAGSIPLDRCRQALPLKGGVMLQAFFSLTSEELEQLFVVLQLWLAGMPHRSLHLLLVMQLRHESLGSQDARYFKTILESSPQALHSKALHFFGAASVAPLEGAEPPGLLELPPLLASLATSTYVLRTQVTSPCS